MFFSHSELCIEGFVWLGLDGILSPAVAHDMGAAFMLYAQGFLPILLPPSVLLFEPTRRAAGGCCRSSCGGGATTLYILWGLTAFPLQLFVKGNSIAYINQATDNTGVASLSVIATWLALFSKIKMMVIFGVANLAVLLVVMEFKRYAFTSLWCAYAEVASVIILAYFWRRGAERPSSPRSKANLKLLCPSDRQAGTQRGPDVGIWVATVVVGVLAGVNPASGTCPVAPVVISGGGAGDQSADVRIPVFVHSWSL